MKKSKLFLTAFAAVATVGSALAIKGSLFGSGSVFCEKPSSTTCTHRMDFRIDPNSGFYCPCQAIPGTVAKVLSSNNTCKTVPPTSRCSSTALGK